MWGKKSHSLENKIAEYIVQVKHEHGIISSYSSVEEGKAKLNKVTARRISYGVWVLLQEITIYYSPATSNKKGTPVVPFFLIYFWSSLLPCSLSGDLLWGLVLGSFLSFSISDEINRYVYTVVRSYFTLMGFFKFYFSCLVLFLASFLIIQHSCNCWRILAYLEFLSDPIWTFLYSPVITVLQN